MNLAATPADRPDNGWRPDRNRIALGVAVSLALHAMLLSAWRTSAWRHAEDESAVPRTLEVWLRPPQPKPEPATKSGTHMPAAPQPRARRERPSVPTRAHPPVIAVAPTPAQPAHAPQAVTEKAAPHFDPDAARRFARRIANDRDPAKAATAVGQFPEKPLQTETRAERAISSAYRPYCKDGVPGGLLAPIYLMLDKKDSGCRW